MNNNIILLNRTFNYESIRIIYNIVTENISVSLYYMNKEKIKLQGQKYRQNNKEKILQISRKYRENNSEKLKIKEEKYRQTKKGKITKIKSNNKRRRNLFFIQMFDNPFADNEQIEWHHITDTYVVAVPQDLHHLYMGKNHRENTMKIVKQIYLGEL